MNNNGAGIANLLATCSSGSTDLASISSGLSAAAAAVLGATCPYGGELPSWRLNQPGLFPDKQGVDTRCCP